jgi:hypothetical protein
MATGALEEMCCGQRLQEWVVQLREVDEMMRKYQKIAWVRFQWDTCTGTVIYFDGIFKVLQHATTLSVTSEGLRVIINSFDGGCHSYLYSFDILDLD